MRNPLKFPHTPGAIGVAHALMPCAMILVLAGCTSPAPWPTSPPTLKDAARAESPCPMIAGTYANAAQPDTTCSVLDTKACNSLSFYFFSSHVPEAAGVSNLPTASDDWPAGSYVRIDQPAADILRISVLDASAAADRRVLAVRELARKNGDFTCEENTVRLRPRVERDAALWAGRRTNRAYLAVSTAADSLVLQSRRQYESYLLWAVGGTMREETSIHRWPKVQ